jgi:hypothetical protein
MNQPIRSISFKKHELHILEYLDSKFDKSQYIKDLISRDMRGENGIENLLKKYFSAGTKIEPPTDETDLTKNMDELMRIRDKI